MLQLEHFRKHSQCWWVTSWVQLCCDIHPLGIDVEGEERSHAHFNGWRKMRVWSWEGYFQTVVDPVSLNKYHQQNTYKASPVTGSPGCKCGEVGRKGEMARRISGRLLSRGFYICVCVWCIPCPHFQEDHVFQTTHPSHAGAVCHGPAPSLNMRGAVAVVLICGSGRSALLFGFSSNSFLFHIPRGLLPCKKKKKWGEEGVRVRGEARKASFSVFIPT